MLTSHRVVRSDSSVMQEAGHHQIAEDHPHAASSFVLPASPSVGKAAGVSTGTTTDSLCITTAVADSSLQEMSSFTCIWYWICFHHYSCSSSMFVKCTFKVLFMVCVTGSYLLWVEKSMKYSEVLHCSLARARLCRQRSVRKLAYHCWLIITCWHLTTNTSPTDVTQSFMPCAPPGGSSGVRHEARHYTGKVNRAAVVSSLLSCPSDRQCGCHLQYYNKQVCWLSFS